jgi:hypothetical protein
MPGLPGKVEYLLPPGIDGNAFPVAGKAEAFSSLLQTDPEVLPVSANLSGHGRNYMGEEVTGATFFLKALTPVGVWGVLTLRFQK